MKFSLGITIYTFFLIIILSIANNASGASIIATPLDEAGVLNFLEENEERVIFDLRWDAIYLLGHLPGAYLINSGTVYEEIVNITLEILDIVSDNKYIAILTYCNCATGSLAIGLANELIEHNYTNIAYLSYSFSRWINGSMLETDINPFPTRNLDSKTEFINSTTLIFTIPLLGLFAINRKKKSLIQ